MEEEFLTELDFEEIEKAEKLLKSFQDTSDSNEDKKEISKQQIVSEETDKLNKNSEVSFVNLNTLNEVTIKLPDINLVDSTLTKEIEYLHYFLKYNKALEHATFTFKKTSWDSIITQDNAVLVNFSKCKVFIKLPKVKIDAEKKYSLTGIFETYDVTEFFSVMGFKGLIEVPSDLILDKSTEEETSVLESKYLNSIKTIQLLVNCKVNLISTISKIFKHGAFNLATHLNTLTTYYNYNLIIENLNLFFEGLWDFDSQSAYSFIIKFPKLTVTNSNNNSTIINNLFIRLKFNSSYSGLSSMAGRVTSGTKRQIASLYTWSHMKKSGYYCWADLCTGGGDTEMSQAYALLISKVNEETLKNYFLTLLSYLQWESKEGGPYHSLEEIDRNYPLESTTYTCEVSSRNFCKLNSYFLDIVKIFLSKNLITSDDICIESEEQQDKISLKESFYVKFRNFLLTEVETSKLESIGPILGIIDSNAPSKFISRIKPNFLNAPRSNNSCESAFLQKIKEYNSNFSSFFFKGQKITAIEVIEEESIGEIQSDMLEFHPYFKNLINLFFTQFLTKQFYEYSTTQSN